MHIGNPRQIVYGSFDTGSSLSWFKCNQPIEKLGCANNNEDSLPRQLYADDPKFSYCISSDLSQINVLLFGPEAKIQGQPGPMFRNMFNDNYFIDLLAITVNNERLDVLPSVFQMSDSGTRGFIVDSGSTSTWLTSVAFEAMKKKMVQMFGRPPIQYTVQGSVHFEICYESRKFIDGRPPVIGFQFVNYLLEIEESNMWYKIPDSTLQCLIILDGKNDTISILGSYQLLDVNVGYDPNKGALYFDKIKCPNP
ncbi:uncharacterized protein LOC110684306 [Chenopodium quinoa]|uniref:uncharacterized protein LOC110684306 n=1 Tax=Chenopodium quinoa TaxID=63459 RepID=UPI000B78F6EC|nr:uncharacterized protein LOC110684306 [Chenopodium quinoa]